MAFGKKCVKVQSFGSTSFFCKKNALQNTPEYCIQGCPIGDTCPYNVVKIYLDDKDNYWFRSTCTKEDIPTDELVKKAITETQYGKCVYKCDNDVVDHQTVNLLFEEDITVAFTMSPFCPSGRHINIMGTKGAISASMDGKSPIIISDNITEESEEIPIYGKDGINGGHGGGDEGIVHTLYEYINGVYEGVSVPEITESCYNHLIVFAAEESRMKNCVVDIDEYIDALEKENKHSYDYNKFEEFVEYLDKKARKRLFIFL